MQQMLDATLQREIAKDCAPRRGWARDWHKRVSDLARRFGRLPRAEYEITSFRELTFRDKFCYCFTNTPEWYSAPRTLYVLRAEAVCAVRRCGVEMWHLWWCPDFMHSVENPDTRKRAKRGSTRKPSASLHKPDWLVFLHTLCAVAESAVAESAVAQAAAPDSAAAACVLTVLNDPLRRIAALGGREGMPRSVGSVYGGAVTRFLGGFRGVNTRTIASPGSALSGACVAVTRDGAKLLVSDADAHVVHVYCAHTGALLRNIGGGFGHGQLHRPRQVWVASDDFVFIADQGNGRVQVLTPQLDFHSYLCSNGPHGVCADDYVVAVSDDKRITVVDRISGVELGRFWGLVRPLQLCFWPMPSYIAVADCENRRISIYSVRGVFVRHIGVGKLHGPVALTCSDANELVVADCGSVVVFNECGDVLWRSEIGSKVASVAVHGSTIYAQTRDKCLVYT